MTLDRILSKVCASSIIASFVEKSGIKTRLFNTFSSDFTSSMVEKFIIRVYLIGNKLISFRNSHSFFLTQYNPMLSMFKPIIPSFVSQLLYSIYLESLLNDHLLIEDRVNLLNILRFPRETLSKMTFITYWLNMRICFYCPLSLFEFIESITWNPFFQSKHLFVLTKLNQFIKIHSLFLVIYIILVL